MTCDKCGKELGEGAIGVWISGKYYRLCFKCSLKL